jgi:hypothetical protein
MAPRMSAAFHSSARREEEAKEGEMANSSQVAESEGFMGTGFSHLWAIPAGVCFAVPMLEFEWLVVNEETLVSTMQYSTLQYSTESSTGCNTIVVRLIHNRASSVSLTNATLSSFPPPLCLV